MLICEITYLRVKVLSRFLKHLHFNRIYPHRTFLACFNHSARISQGRRNTAWMVKCHLRSSHLNVKSLLGLFLWLDVYDVICKISFHLLVISFFNSNKVLILFLIHSLYKHIWHFMDSFHEEFRIFNNWEVSKLILFINNILFFENKWKTSTFSLMMSIFLYSCLYDSHFIQDW